MTYQRERARPMATEQGRCFEVTKVRIGADGHISQVLWGQVGARSDRVDGPQDVANAAEVVDAIHDGAQVKAVFTAKGRLPERAFVVVEHPDGRECIAFEGAPSPGRNLDDMELFDNEALQHRQHRAEVPCRPTAGPATGGRMKTFAVSKVELDADGRITAILWGRVDTGRNAWAAPERVVPVGQAVDAIHAGNRVFALFPAPHGHVPDRPFMVADYDGGFKTIVLDGPTAPGREVHDMDRLNRSAALRTA